MITRHLFKMDTHLEFHDAIINHGWDPGAIFADGLPHRFDTDKPKDKAGWYVFFGEAGAYGSWKGEKYKWSSGNGDKWDETKKAEYKAKMERVEKDRETAKAKAKKRAQFIWKKATEASQDHPYLKTKGVKAYGLRNYKGALVVPLRNHEGDIESVQFISEKGDKRFLKDGNIQGNYFEIPGNDEKLCCEGYATGASGHEATGATVTVAFNCGNLDAVAEKVKADVIASDNDAWTKKPDGTPWNPGREKALSIGWKHNVKVAIPEFPDVGNKPTDFNDLATLEGISAVKKQIEAAKYPQEILLEECEADKGAPYRPEHLEGLNTFKRRDLPGWRTLRHSLKRLQIGVTELDKCITEHVTSIEGSRLTQLETAKKAIETYGPENVFTTEIFIWRYNGSGLWQKADDRDVKRTIHAKMDDDDISKGLVDSVLDLFKTETFRANHRFDIDTTAINCLNGELHWSGGKWELRAHSRENYRTSQLPVGYNRAAMAPRFEQFLAEVFEGDPDQAEKIFLIIELFGYSLLSSSAFEVFTILIGPGANGKSVLLDILTELLGTENVAAVQPNQFDNRFQRAHLHCKLANVVTEIAEGHEIQDAQLKSICSGELTTAEHKHKPPFDFRPFATCWFASNHMPHSRDFSDALFRRAVIIPFNRIFLEHEQDRDLKNKLKAELPGILNLALEGMAAVFQRNGFTKTSSCEKAKNEWRTECDQIAQFAQEKAVFGPELKTQLSDGYRVYTEWAAEVGIRRTVGRRKFAERMNRLGAKSQQSTGGYYYLFGVYIK